MTEEICGRIHCKHNPNAHEPFARAAVKTGKEAYRTNENRFRGFGKNFYFVFTYNKATPTYREN